MYCLLTLYSLTEANTQRLVAVEFRPDTNERTTCGRNTSNTLMKELHAAETRLTLMNELHVAETRRTLMNELHAAETRRIH